MKHQVPDHAIREEALHPGQSFILESPAGSGKTALLTARFLALLSRVSHPRQVMAVTFTRKAAAEMATRITGILQLAAAEGVDTTEDPWQSVLLSLGKKVLQHHRDHPALLFTPESLKVGTFHGFCASIVRAWPLEAEVPPGLGVLEDEDQAAMLEGAVDQHLRGLLSTSGDGEERTAFARRLAAANNDFGTVSGQLVDLLRRRDRLRDFAGFFSQQDIALELHRRLDGYVRGLLSGLEGYFSDRKTEWVRLKKALRDGGGPLAEIFPDSVPGSGLEPVQDWKCAARIFLTKAGTLRRSLTPSNGFPPQFTRNPAARLITGLPKEIVDRMAFVAEWPEPGEDNVGLAALTDILLLAAGSVRRLHEMIRSRGMDYLELEAAALRALSKSGRPSESLIFYHDHLRHILVDEAQDLNDVQVNVLGRLAEGWEPGDGRTVFLVGDPKQSIYRFRRAEVGLFYALRTSGLPREHEAPLPLKPLLVTSHFRSRPPLVQFSNQLFEKVMAAPNPDCDEVSFSPSKTVREGTQEFIPVRAVLFNEEVSEENAPSPEEREAAWVAASVARLHEDRPHETIGLLIPVRTHLATYVRALYAHGVPVQLMEGIPLGERPEVKHIQNLLTALVRPYDNVAWAGAVRAPWFWISNQELLDLASSRRLWSHAILSKEKVSPERAPLVDVLREAVRMFGREPFGLTLSRAWEDLDGPCVTAGRYGEGGISNVRAFFELLDRCSGLPGEEALAKVRRLLANAYSPPDPRGVSSNIQMMTIHRAKGLEFDHVFAVHLHYKPLGGGRGEQPAYRMERLPGAGSHFLAAATADRRTGEQNLASFLLKDLDRCRTLAEARRLFYVAVTRPRESLTLSGRGVSARGDERRGDFKNPLSALLELFPEGQEGLTVLWNPLPPTSTGAREKRVFSELEPPPFEAEPLPYEVRSPSRVEEETSQAAEFGEEEGEGGYARARGIVIHRLLETLVRGDPFPPPPAVAAALSGEGVPFAEATEMAPAVLEEASGAWALPEFLHLRESAHETYTEWALEDFDGTRTLRVGRFDLLLRKGDRWVIVDYKAGRPDPDPEAWLDRQVRHYRPQVAAYAQMVAKALHIPEETVGWAMLFTALPRLVWQGGRPFF